MSYLFPDNYPISSYYDIKYDSFLDDYTWHNMILYIYASMC